MNPLQYTSEEMFSSTELIRKSKAVFDKLNKKEIEKAVILRDGKPAFMLIDFSVYEKLMHDYLSLQEFLENSDSKLKVEKPIEEEVPKEQIMQEEVKKEEVSQKHEIDEKDLEDALAEIDNLDLDSFEEKKNTKESLKEFWE